MKLTLFERLVLLGTLPKEGSYVTLKVLTDLKMSLAPTEEEIKEWKIVSDLVNNKTTWETNGEVEIPIGEKANDIVVSSLKKLNWEKRLPSEAVSVFEKFVPAKEREE